MAYDKADWHSGGNFPDDVPSENGGTHIGMFLAWSINAGLEGDIHREDESSRSAVVAVRERRMTGREFLFQVCDGKFWEDDLSDDGNRFARVYYGLAGDKPGKYIDDYNHALGGALPTLYHIANTWENYDKLAPVISKRFEHWRKTGSIEPKWWKLW